MNALSFMTFILGLLLGLAGGYAIKAISVKKLLTNTQAEIARLSAKFEGVSTPAKTK